MPREDFSQKSMETGSISPVRLILQTMFYVSNFSTVLTGFSVLSQLRYFAFYLWRPNTKSKLKKNPSTISVFNLLINLNHLSISLTKFKFLLGLAGVALTFLTAAPVALHFPLVTKTVLVTPVLQRFYFSNSLPHPAGRSEWAAGWVLSCHHNTVRILSCFPCLFFFQILAVIFNGCFSVSLCYIFWLLLLKLNKRPWTYLQNCLNKNELQWHLSYLCKLYITSAEKLP